MIRLHIFLKTLTPILFLLHQCPAIAGDAKVEQIPVVEAAAQRVTLHAEKVTSQEAVDLFAKASGINFDISNEQGGQPQGPAPLIYYDVDIHDLTIEPALDRLGKIINRRMEMQQSGNLIRVQPYNPAGFYNPYGQGVSSGGPLAVSPQGVSRLANFPPSPGNPPTLQVEFRVEGGGAQKVLGMPQVIVEQATDDQGNTLTTAKTGSNYGAELIAIGQQTPVARLKCPDPTPKKIAGLKGTIEWQIPSMYSRITFTNLHDGKPTKVEFNGWEAEIAPLVKNGGTWQIALKLHRGNKLSANVWNAKKDAFVQAFVQSSVKGADGKLFDGRGGGSGGGSRDETQAQLYIGRNNEPDGGSVAPDSLIWEVVQETTPLRVPFQAGDLPVP